MGYLINLFTPETYEAFSRSSRSVTGFPQSQLKTTSKVSIGDKFLCYMTKLSRWVGVLQVASEPFEDDTPIFMPDDDPYVIRFRVEPLVWLPKELAVPIHDEKVWNHLSFTRDLPAGSTRWTGKVRRSLVDLSEHDGAFLDDLLLSQQQDGKHYPVDEDQYQHYLPRPVQRTGGVVTVTVPDNREESEEPPDQGATETSVEPRESYRVQAQLARIGETMGFQIWLPRGDRSSVLTLWTPREDVLLDQLPLNYDDVTLKTIENIDVIWLRGRSIVRAFEVEHTTAVYSGILRMADLLALQPNMEIKLHIVAPIERKDKVMSEIRRPVFSLLEKGPLYESCSFISYDSLAELADYRHLEYMSDSVLEQYEEEAI